MQHRLTIVALLVIAALPAAAAAAGAEGAAGRWRGAIELPTGELEIAVELRPDEAGSWRGTIDIPAQNLRGFELSALAVEAGRVRFEMRGIPGLPTFEGAIAETGEAISGTFRQGPQTLPFSLRRLTSDQIAAREEAAAAEPPQPESVEGLPAEPVPGEGAAGDWLGALDVGPVVLRLGLHVEEAGDGKLRGTLDSIDQGAESVLGEISFAAGALRFAIPPIGARYEGMLNDDGSAVAGTWSQGGRQLPLTFHRLAERFAIRRPQHPTAPFPYRSEEVTFRSAAGGIELAGTLVLPEGGGPWPAVVLVSGSGPQDRDETLMGHKPFLVLADALARRGIASLRYDDRGAGASGGDHLGSTVDDFAADAAAAVAFLAAHRRLTGGAVGIVGHSEGGLTAPMVAAGSEEVDFLVLLAPIGVPAIDLLRRQVADIYRLQGVPEELVARAVAAQDEDLALVADAELATEKLREQLQQRAATRREQYSAEERALLQVTAEGIEQGIAVATSAWFRSLMRQAPARHLSRVEVPVLALFGEKDIQVAAEENAAGVRSALAAAQNSDVDVRVLSGLNHLFQPAVTGGIDEYGRIETTFAPEALEIVGDWILARFAKR